MSSYVQFSQTSNKLTEKKKNLRRGTVCVGVLTIFLGVFAAFLSGIVLCVGSSGHFSLEAAHPSEIIETAVSLRESNFDFSENALDHCVDLPIEQNFSTFTSGFLVEKKLPQTLKSGLIKLDAVFSVFTVPSFAMRYRSSIANSASELPIFDDVRLRSVILNL